MTGGYAVILGLVGRNFAAGMSGGLAYVLDLERMFHGRCNTDMVDIEPVSAEADQVWLHDILQDFVLKTGSQLAQTLLSDWPQSLQLFHKVPQRPTHKHIPCTTASYSQAHSLYHSVLLTSTLPVPQRPTHKHTPCTTASYSQAYSD